MQKNVFAEKGFIHIMGPCPAIVTGEKGAWDEWVMESCDIFKDEHTYYWYYHAREDRNANPKEYRIGVATAPTPLGPWTKYQGNPILDYGPPGSWDDESVDGACIMKEGAYNLGQENQTYYMWYSGRGHDGRHIGLATATSPLGPWKKYEGNPIVKDFGYLGNVVKVNGKFFMYTQYPVDKKTDQGPFCVAIAKRPEGPWTKYDRNPILSPGVWGAWDDGGYSEAGVRHNEGVFHWFYSGTKTLKLESIGYAYGFDGYNFTKYTGNPVIPLNRIPDTSGMAEITSLIEPPFVYVYHTLRYFSRLYIENNPDGEWETEDLGIQILSTSSTFRIPMPILNIRSLGPNQKTQLEQCCPVSLENTSGCVLTVECSFPAQAKEGVRLHVRSSYDGIAYDTSDLCTFDFDASAGETIRKTVDIASKARFFKITCENLDGLADVSYLKVTTTLVS